MRIAIIADIHGNTLALDATLQDINKVGVDGYFILGDLVSIGPDPIGVLQRLSSLDNTQIIRGNTDRYIISGDRPPPNISDIGSDIEKLRVFTEIAGSFAWTQGAITTAGWFDWIAKLPLELETTLPDGTDCLLVHAIPGNDDGSGIDKDMPDSEIIQLLEGCAADLICIGHTHQPINRKVGKWHIINPGSISNPRYPVLDASYALLDSTKKGYRIEHRLVEYDREQVISQVREINHPGADFIIKHMLGLIK